eukprot:CAMPEP_0173178140 /NCGR_PEP_ID=MMETSP1141-20130122/5368_1 /TAXON_ID=483371 /ORGANISM="non described non described, Strain CCMP2298" /LENGTH=75 /DNA_ID=CAMNT_0014100593 /DNA_START=130 /DNA_END=358 /DNA_ORIENTATION=+
MGSPGDVTLAALNAGRMRWQRADSRVEIGPLGMLGSAAESAVNGNADAEETYTGTVQVQVHMKEGTDSSDSDYGI